MSVVINELEVVPAEPGTPQPAPAATVATPEPSPETVARHVEHLLQHRLARAERLRAY